MPSNLTSKSSKCCSGSNIGRNNRQRQQHEKLLQLQLLALQNANILHKENFSMLFSLSSGSGSGKGSNNKSPMWQHQSFCICMQQTVATTQWERQK